MSLADVLGMSKQQKPWRSKEEDPREKVLVNFGENERRFIFTPNLNQADFWNCGVLFFMLWTTLGMRLTSTVCAHKTSVTILSDVPTARKLRLPGLVFHVRLGMEYVHGLPVYRGARSLYASDLWRMTQMQLNSAEEGFLVDEEGLLRDTAHLQSLCAIITTETKSTSKPCACVSVCPSVLAWGMCAYSAYGCVEKHMWRPETVLTRTPQSLSTLNAEFWSLTGWLIWLVWLARLPWDFPTSTVQMLEPQVGCLPSIHVSTRGQTCEAQFKASSSQDVCLLPTGVSSRKMLLIHHAVQRDIHCSTNVDSRGVSRNGVKKWVL